jgi:hypothetical protein
MGHLVLLGRGQPMHLENFAASFRVGEQVQ